MVALVAALVALLSLPVPASASRGIATGFADPGFISSDAHTRGLLFNRSLNAGGEYARIVIGWKRMAPTKPAQATNPDDPAYRFAALDAAVRDASKRGLKLLFTLHAAPSWAGGTVPDHSPIVTAPETWRPRPQALAKFAKALARRYSGDHVPIYGGVRALRPLPRVSLIEPWNEPNLTAFLSPQWERGKPTGAAIYRGLLNAVYAGYHSVQPDATVIAGATGPEGDTTPGRRTAPLKFLRQLLCLSGRKQLRARHCPVRAHFDVLSHHPISAFGEQPSKLAPGTDDAGVREMGEIRRMLRAAERQRTVLPARIGRRPLWATEIWWETSPPSVIGDAPSPRRQARNLAEALKLLWKQHVPVALFFQVRDDARVSGPPRSGWATGVFKADNTPKPSFSAVRMPFVAKRLSRRTVSVWARSPATGMLKVRTIRGGRGQTVARFRVKAGDVVQRRLKLRGSARLLSRIDEQTSLRSRVPGGRRAASG